MSLGSGSSGWPRTSATEGVWVVLVRASNGRPPSTLVMLVLRLVEVVRIPRDSRLIDPRGLRTILRHARQRRPRVELSATFSTSPSSTTTRRRAGLPCDCWSSRARVSTRMKAACAATFSARSATYSRTAVRKMATAGDTSVAASAARLAPAGIESPSRYISSSSSSMSPRRV